jgi:saccharopine dehydrogenase (NAD+, L-lysine-forming)
VAGRDPDATRDLADRLGLQARVFDLGDATGVARGLAGVGAVVHAAGPFSATWEPMVRGCIAAGCHYLDITGEIEVLEGVHGLDARAAAAGIHLVPGVGFDVVPTDCAGALAVDACPGAVRLDLAFTATGGPSRGTARTALERLGRPGAVRRDGRIVQVPTGSVRRTIPFSTAARPGVAIPWGDVSTAWRSTGVPEVRVFIPLAAPAATLARWLAPLLRTAPVRRLARHLVDRFVSGPDAQELASGSARIWAEASDDAGATATVELVTPNGYALTAETAVRALERVMAGRLAVPPGAHTPSAAFGSGFVYEVPGVASIRRPGRR